MAGIDINSFMLIALAAISAAGVVWALAYPLLSGSARAEKRMRSLQKSPAAKAVARNQVGETQKRRKALQDTLNELDAKQKERSRASLKVRIQRAGLTWSAQTFYLFSAVSGLAALAGGLAAGLSLVISALFGVAAALGGPRWMISFLTKRRQKKFLMEFPNAIDIVVRGVKAGLPLNDCVRMVAAEAPAPVGPEFRQIVETQALGLSLADCVARMYERMPLPEVNFFAIVVAIQQTSGGSLSEALGNLSRVLRERKKMKQKIQAMSQEAKASAAIIGALPVIVMGLVFLTSPEYISLLWTEPLGHIMLIGSAFWMMCGVLVMRNMINFDF